MLKVVAKSNTTTISTNYASLSAYQVQVIQLGGLTTFNQWLLNTNFIVDNADSLELSFGYSQYQVASAATVGTEEGDTGTTSSGVPFSDFQAVLTVQVLMPSIACNEKVVPFYNRFGCPDAILIEKEGLQVETDTTTFTSNYQERVVFATQRQSFNGMAEFPSFQEAAILEYAKDFVAARYHHIDGVPYLIQNTQFDEEEATVSFKATEAIIQPTPSA